LKDRYRLDNNFEGLVDVLIIDVDDTCNIEQALLIFKKYKFYLITSKSHQIDKGGVVCDRFRLFFELAETQNDRVLLEYIYSSFIDIYPFIDTSCRNVSRFFYSSPADAKVIFNEGKKYSSRMIAMGVEEEVVEKTTPTMPEKKGWLKRPENVEVSYGETSEENKLVGVGIFLDNEFVQGNKSNCLFQASSMMVSDGFDENFIVDHLLSEWESRRGSRDKFADAKYNICGAFKY